MGRAGGAPSARASNTSHRGKTASPVEDLRERRAAALRRFVREHLDSGRGDVLFALWFRVDDPERLHLIEVAEKVSYGGRGDWRTLAFVPPPAIELPGVRTLEFTYMSPEEFLEGVENPDSEGHRVYREILRHGCVPIYRRPRSRLAGRLLKAVEHAPIGRA